MIKQTDRKAHSEVAYDDGTVWMFQRNNTARQAKLVPNRSDRGRENDWCGVEFTDTDEFGSCIWHTAGFDGNSSVFGNMDRRDALLLARAWVKRGA